MSKADIMVKFHVKRDEISQSIRDDADKILKAIDIDKVLENPKDYLTQVGKIFMEVQTPRLDTAFEMGRKYGKDTLP
tara:strand:+ start:33 stop:263 length:231 start_codon:yes stop_codon:yes gene_type:complete